MIQGLGADKHGWDMQRFALGAEVPHHRARQPRRRPQRQAVRHTTRSSRWPTTRSPCSTHAGIETGPRGRRVDGWSDQRRSSPLKHPERVRSLDARLHRVPQPPVAARAAGGWATMATERGMGAMTREAGRPLGDRTPLVPPPAAALSAGSGRSRWAARRTRSSRRCGRSSPPTTRLAEQLAERRRARRS